MTAWTVTASLTDGAGGSVSATARASVTGGYSRTPTAADVAYTSLYRTGDTVAAALARQTTVGPVVFPAGVFECSDFAQASGIAGFLCRGPNRGLAGAGVDQTFFRMKPLSSTKAAAVNALTSSQTNQEYLLRTGTGLTGLELSGFTLTGTEQGHYYAGVLVNACASINVHDVTITGVPGGFPGPPTETMALNLLSSTGRAWNVEIDGRRMDPLTADPLNGTPVSSSPLGVNNVGSAGTVAAAPLLTLTDFYCHDSGQGMPAFWQAYDVATTRFRSVNNGSHCLNHERCGRIVHHLPYLEPGEGSGSNAKFHARIWSDQGDFPFIFDGVTFTPGPVAAAGKFAVMMNSGEGPITQRTPPIVHDTMGGHLTYLLQTDSGLTTVTSV